MRLEWEDVDGNGSGPDVIRRAKVTGGWLVFAYDAIFGASGLTFIPDPNHKWDEMTLPGR